MCYKALSAQVIFSNEFLIDHSIKFASQYVALCKAMTDTSKMWHVKPKLHMCLELCAEKGKPSLCWTYKDEDYGGAVARLSRRRGGILSAQAFSHNLLQRFKLVQPVIRTRS